MNRYLRSAVGSAIALATISIIGAVSAAKPPLPAPEATSSIRAQDLKKHLSFLASDELGGRFTLSPSNLIAARYLASQLESYGYKGAARDGSFFQKVPLSYRSVDLSQTGITLDSSSGPQTFRYGDDFGSLLPVDADASGALVFVGYGISSPSNKYDDYAGLDVKGKIVFALTGVPSSLAKVRLGADEQGELAAISHGAAAVITVAPPQLVLAWEQVKEYLKRDEAGLPPPPGSEAVHNASVVAGPRLTKALAAIMGVRESDLISPDGKLFKPADLQIKTRLRMKVNVKPAPPAQNVVGILAGSDPVLKDQYVVFSAHYDHLKTGDNGEVYNGADDDGSGTAAVLEIAEALSVGTRSKRSILIVFHTGEEEGLYGSEFNTDYEPVVPLEKLVADFNIDMIGRSRPDGDQDPLDRELTDEDSLYVIGADKLSTELNQISEETNAATARMRFDYTYNDEKHPERFYYRSDHYNYAKHGIPIIFYFTGVHRDYHKPTDDVDKIDFRKMERITRMIFATGWRVANLDHRLAVDHQPER